MAILWIATVVLSLSLLTRGQTDGAAVETFVPGPGLTLSSDSTMDASGAPGMPGTGTGTAAQPQTTVGQGYVCANGQCYYNTVSGSTGGTGSIIRLQSDFMTNPG